MRSLFPLIFGLGLAGCVAPDAAPERVFRTPDVAFLTDGRPEGARAGSCWGKRATPAVIETVTEQVIVQPAELDDSGGVVQPAIYRTETRQAIVQQRSESWFETLCPEALDADFTASLQRALRARGNFSGEITGELDNKTRTALRRFQKSQGFDSAVLALETARTLGLAPVEPAQQD